MTAPNLTPAEALECLRSWDDTTVEWDAWACRYSNHLNGGPDEDACLRRRCFKIIGEALSEHEATKAKLAAYEAKMPSAFDMVNDAYPFAIAIRDERVGRTLSTPASGVPSLRSAMKDAFRVITGEPLVVEAKEPSAAVPSASEGVEALQHWFNTFRLVDASGNARFLECIVAVDAALTKAVAAVPSDEEIRKAIRKADSTRTPYAVGHLTEAVEMLAKRIGVKL